MAKKKYYAIKVGRKNNVIVHSWDECSVLVTGFPGAIFKGFMDHNSAKLFLKDNNEKLNTNLTEIYVDGSFKNSKCGWAFIIVEKGTVIYEEYGLVTHEKALSMRNIAGELSAAMHAAKWAGDKPVLIVHDYLGIASFATNRYKPNNIFTQMYKDYMSHKHNITYKHVQGHSNNKFNDLVDSLASKVTEG